MTDIESPRVVTFGEIMMRLATPGHLRFGQAASLEMTFGGGEANVAVSLAQLGVRSSFVTRLPANDFGAAARDACRRWGVDTAHIVWGGSRIGIYFLETGASQRGSKVVYDRAGSALAEIQPGMVDWQAALEGATWFHWTGITPAVSDSAAAAMEEGLEAAKARGLTISVDLNYRGKLWKPEKAGKVMSRLVPYCSIAIGNEEDAEKVFGIRAAGSDVSRGELSREAYAEVARQLAERFELEQVAVTLRESHSATHNDWSGMLYADGQASFSRTYNIHVVDRVGGGDAFAAGLIYARLKGWDPQRAVEFAAAASCLKHSVPGDFNLVTVREVEDLAGGGGSGRVQR